MSDIRFILFRGHQEVGPHHHEKAAIPEHALRDRIDVAHCAEQLNRDRKAGTFMAAPGREGAGQCGGWVGRRFAALVVGDTFR